MPRDAATWRRFLFQACLNSVIPWTMLAWGERTLDAGLAATATPESATAAGTAAADAERFDVTRPASPASLAFGFG